MEGLHFEGTCIKKKRLHSSFKQHEEFSLWRKDECRKMCGTRLSIGGEHEYTLWKKGRLKLDERVIEREIEIK